MQFGVSSHLVHEKRLTRDHLVEIAAHGFRLVEVFATRAHFDYHDATAVQDLAGWLRDTGLALHSVHAPAFEALSGGAWVGSYSNASGDEARRRQAIEETRAALEIARVVPFRYLVVHLGMPAAEKVPPSDNQPAAARRSVEQIAELAAAVGVTVALEVIPNALSSPEALCRLIEDDLELSNVGICLDYGHANLMGDVAEAVETISGHLMTTHVHDNGGRRDEHLVPYAGRIDWELAMMATQKVGYDGALLFEVGASGDLADVLRRCARARQRIEQTFVTF